MSQNMHITCPHCLSVNRVPAQRLHQDPKCGRCHNSLTGGHPLALNSANFQKHLTRSELPMVVDFWAPWCQPCQMMAPAFAQAADILGPAVRLAKLDTQAEPNLGAQYNVMSIPTMVLFRNGREAARTSGAMNAQQIAGWVKSNL